MFSIQFRVPDAQQLPGFRRLTAMHAPIHFDRPLRPAAWVAIRTAIAVGIAMLLILVALPALIAAQASTI